MDQQERAEKVEYIKVLREKSREAKAVIESAAKASCAMWLSNVFVCSMEDLRTHRETCSHVAPGDGRMCGGELRHVAQIACLGEVLADKLEAELNSTA